MSQNDYIPMISTGKSRTISTLSHIYLSVTRGVGEEENAFQTVIYQKQIIEHNSNSVIYNLLPSCVEWLKESFPTQKNTTYFKNQSHVVSKLKSRVNRKWRNYTKITGMLAYINLLLILETCSCWQLPCLTLTVQGQLEKWTYCWKTLPVSYFSQFIMLAYISNGSYKWQCLELGKGSTQFSVETKGPEELLCPTLLSALSLQSLSFCHASCLLMHAVC